jgi:hypothetical protein
MPEHMPISFLFNNEGDVVVEFPEEALSVSLPVTCVARTSTGSMCPTVLP